MRWPQGDKGSFTTPGVALHSKCVSRNRVVRVAGFAPARGIWVDWPAPLASKASVSTGSTTPAHFLVGSGPGQVKAALRFSCHGFAVTNRKRLAQPGSHSSCSASAPESATTGSGVSRSWSASPRPLILSVAYRGFTLSRRSMAFGWPHGQSRSRSFSSCQMSCVQRTHQTTLSVRRLEVERGASLRIIAVRELGLDSVEYVRSAGQYRPSCV